jgi:hypothetical protein
MVDGITSMPGSIDNGDEYGDEMVADGAPEFSKYKRDKVFLPVESTRRKSKICCTVGPSTSEVEDIVKLLDEGMTTARFNLSHGSIKDMLKLLGKYK